MNGSHVPKILLFSETRDGSQKGGRAPMRCHANCKTAMKAFYINAGSWEVCTTESSSWNETVTMAARFYTEKGGEQDKNKTACNTLGYRK